MSLWEQIQPEVRDRIELGERAVLYLRKHESIERWRETGQAIIDLQAACMNISRSNKPMGKAYNPIWTELSKHVPHLVALASSTRSDAGWLATNWEAVSAWMEHSLSHEERWRLNHPTAVKRRYTNAHKPSESTTADATSPSPRIALQDQVIKLQAEVDMLRKKGGGGLLPSASVDDVTEALFAAHNTAFVRRLIEALNKQLVAEERQDSIEAKRSNKQPRRTSKVAESS